jgi:hypothetical protein
MNRIFFSLIFCAALMSGCNQSTNAKKESSKIQKKVWIFGQFNVPEEDEKIDSYWYFGRINESEYKAISSNQLTTGFLRLTNVHYWGDDAAHAYEDETYEGEMIFKVEDIRKITKVKRVPVIPEQQEIIVEQLQKTEEQGGA